MKPIELPFRIFVLAALSAVVAACAPVPVGTPIESSASATVPTLAIGDSWTYRVRDGFTGFDRGTQHHRVVEVTGDRIGMTITLQNGVEESWAYDRGGNWLKHPAHGLQSFDYSPPYRAFDFPIAPGKTWRTRLTATDPADGRRFAVWIEGTVLGWERLKVPAGEFDAIRIKRVVFFNYQEYNVRGRSEIVEYEWYAPAVKQAVRREGSADYFSYLYGGGSTGGLLRAQFNEGGSGGWVRDDWLISELAAYSVR
ncbi:MAG: hypothetical protein ACRET7_15175 [Burkholderiales bacterium]